MVFSRIPFVQTRRDAWVEINLANIEHNIKVLKKYIDPRAKFLAVVKADAYGHGAAMVTPTLLASGADMLGVASIDEGIQLRNTGIEAPILVLGAAPDWAFVSAVEHDIQLSIFTEDHIKACIDTYNKLKIKPVVHIKVDTGMNRIGICADEAIEFINKVSKINSIKLEGVFTHLACAENITNTAKQKQAWEYVISRIETKNLTLHAASTAGMIGYQDLHYDMIRSGIGIYGLLPDFPENVHIKPNLKQVMSLKGRIVYIKEIPENSGISYGYTYITENATKVATIPIGYADGISRHLSNKIYGLINGQKVRQIGNITMDQMMFDISDIKDVNTGDIITLLGKDEDGFISIDEWAKELETINYVIPCRLRVRLPRVYTRDI